MRFELLYTLTASAQLDALKGNPSHAKRLHSVRKALGLMEVDLRHPSLNTHKYESIVGKNGEEIFEAYAENNTPAAYRIFWHYGPGQGKITIVAITPHP